VLVPGVTITSTGSSGLSGQDVGGTVGDKRASLSVHGSRSSEMPLLLDGLRYNNMQGQGGGSNTTYKINTGSVEEMSIELSGMSAESEVSGVRVNVIPKEGGNTFKGSVFATYTGDALQADNLSDDLQAQGTLSVPVYDSIWDLNPAVGGPIAKDRLWFFGAFRYWGSDEIPVGAFFDTNPLDYVYTPDPSRPKHNRVSTMSENVRVTWKATPKNKFGFFVDNQGPGKETGRATPTQAPEASPAARLQPVVLTHATWNAPATNKLLLEAGMSIFIQGHTFDASNPEYSALEQSTNTRFRAPATVSRFRYNTYAGRASMSYVTGSHALKAGTQWMWGFFRATTTANYDTNLAFLNGAARSVTVYTTPYTIENHLKMNLSPFAQDQWTMRRVTLNLGVRLDYLNGEVPEQHLPPVQFVGARDFAAVKNVPNWKDLSTRLGASWDVFGTGKTALKGSFGRYVIGMTTDLANATNPINTSVNNTTRSWSDPNRDFIPQESELGPLQNSSFGQTVITTRYDPDVTEGFQKRGYNWEGSVAVQHELAPGVSLNAAYFRRWFGNFLVNVNTAVSPSDYDEYFITAPLDPRLPNGGGYRVSGLYDIKPSKFGQVQNLVTFADNYGEQTDVYDGFDVSINFRLPQGALFQGGTNTGREVTDNCDVVQKVQNPAGGPALASLLSRPFSPVNYSAMASPSPLYCRIDPPMQTQVKLLGVYPLPWWGLQTSATFQSLPGPIVTATYVATNQEIAPSLGRNLSGTVTTANVELIAPGSDYGDRLNQLDVRLTKTFALRRTRLQAQFDVYNVLNANPVVALNTRYGGAWLAPQFVLPARLFKFGAQFDF
jgi:hypothetical protein